MGRGHPVKTASTAFALPAALFAAPLGSFATEPTVLQQRISACNVALLSNVFTFCHDPILAHGMPVSATWYIRLRMEGSSRVGYLALSDGERKERPEDWHEQDQLAAFQNGCRM
jgi:hypothetical protein